MMRQPGTMRVFYYQLNGETHLVCSRGPNPGRLSRIWEGCNTCSWIVPGTFRDETDDED